MTKSQQGHDERWITAMSEVDVDEMSPEDMDQEWLDHIDEEEA